jgi:hypothetical protein
MTTHDDNFVTSARTTQELLAGIPPTREAFEASVVEQLAELSAKVDKLTDIVLAIAHRMAEWDPT